MFLNIIFYLKLVIVDLIKCKYAMLASVILESKHYIVGGKETIFLISFRRNWLIAFSKKLAIICVLRILLPKD